MREREEEKILPSSCLSIRSSIMIMWTWRPKKKSKLTRQRGTKSISTWLKKRTNPDEERRGDLEVLCSVPDQLPRPRPRPGQGPRRGTGIGRPIRRPTRQNIAQVLKSQGVDNIKVVDKIPAGAQKINIKVQRLRLVANLLPGVSVPADLSRFNSRWTRSQCSRKIICASSKQSEHFPSSAVG